MRFPLLALAAVALAATAPSATAQTIYVVRHAERADASRDSDLSPAGVERAAALDSVLAHARLTRVIATEFQRTRKTAQPSASRHGLDVQVVSVQGGTAAHVGAVADAARAAGPQGTVLVVGHSNTVPRIVGALGGPTLGDLCDTEYATMFVVTLRLDGQPSVARLRYGAPDADGTSCPVMMVPPGR